MLNTIGCLWYNLKEREKTEREYQKAKAVYDSHFDEVFDIEDEAEHMVAYKELEREREMLALLDMRRYAAQFHRCRNKWFAGVIDSFEKEVQKAISRKQYECFSRYAYDRDDYSSKNGCSYCRVGDYLVTLTRHRYSGYSMTVNHL